MKLNPGLAKSLLMAASIGMVVPVLAQTNAQRPASRGKSGPGTNGEATATDAAASGDEVQIPGMVVPRASGGFLSVILEEGRLRVNFYDADKKQVGPDVPRGTARWNPPNKTGEERTVLNPTPDGLGLKGVVMVRPPYTYKIQISLLDGNGGVAESHRLDFKP